MNELSNILNINKILGCSFFALSVLILFLSGLWFFYLYEYHEKEKLIYPLFLVLLAFILFSISVNLLVN